MTRYPADRPCPLSGKPPARTIGHATAAAVAAGNPTYRADYADILGISPDDEFPFVESPDGFIYAGWLPPEDFLRRLYEEVIDHSRTTTTTISYRQGLLEFGAGFFQFIERHAGPARPLRLLDFGCGYGALLQILASRDIVSTGYDPSAERAQRATADGRFPIFGHPDDVAGAGPFDLFVCTEVLEHMPRPREALRLIKANAAPGALLALTVPDNEPAALARTLAAGGPLPFVVNPWEHLNYFSPATLRAMLAEEGFEVVRDYGAAADVREAVSRVGEPGGRLRSGARLLKRALAAPASTQLFCRVR